MIRQLGSWRSPERPQQLRTLLPGKQFHGTKQTHMDPFYYF